MEDSAAVLGAMLAFGHVSCEENHDRVKVRARQTAHPAIGMIGAGIAEDGGASRHALTEFFGKRRQALVVDSEGAQAVPCKRDRDPP